MRNSGYTESFPSETDIFLFTLSGCNCKPLGNGIKNLKSALNNCCSSFAKKGKKKIQNHWRLKNYLLINSQCSVDYGSILFRLKIYNQITANKKRKSICRIPITQVRERNFQRSKVKKKREQYQLKSHWFWESDKWETAINGLTNCNWNLELRCERGW